VRPDFLIVGLGNPGKKYKKTRHNVGFMVCDYISSSHNVDFRFGPGNSQISFWTYQDAQVMIAKPMTFMNLSGQAVHTLVTEFELNTEKLLVISDDFYLPLGTIRMRASGSSGKHNGLQSVIEKIGTNQFPRLRVGICGKDQVINSVEFVLNKFKRAELKIIDRIIPVCVDAIRFWMSEGIDQTMSLFNKHHDVALEI
jgi:PTH1 family peptidyl-tRNA hydrolase